MLLGIPSQITRALPKRLKGPREGGTPRAGRDVDTIGMDVARCMHHTNGELHDQNREVLRESLISLLAAVVDAETVFYYQVCAYKRPLLCVLIYATVPSRCTRPLLCGFVVLIRVWSTPHPLQYYKCPPGIMELYLH